MYRLYVRVVGDGLGVRGDVVAHFVVFIFCFLFLRCV